MTRPITRELLEQYASVKGDLDELKDPGNISTAAWELVDELLLDLHLIEHGYADEGYARHVDRRIRGSCTDDQVAEQLERLGRRL